ncbi:MAG: hypothetical protein LH609_14890, partial [Rudanella sp.]|nr:hypothetical protein [Rudanella sp.]
MQERPDNEAPQDGLDRLFRKSAEEFDPLYDPAAWQTMSAKLDERDRVIAWGYALRWGLGIMAFILLLSVGWYGYKQSKAGTVAVSGTSRHMQPERSLPIDSQFPNPKNGEPKAVASPSQQDLAGQRIDNQPMNNENETSQRRRLNWSVVRQPLSPKQENVAGNTINPLLTRQKVAHRVVRAGKADKNRSRQHLNSQQPKKAARSWACPDSLQQVRSLLTGSLLTGSLLTGSLLTGSLLTG